MDGTCWVCHKVVAGSDIKYTADARVICEACLARSQAVPARGYEFDVGENDVIRRLVGPMRFVGVMSIVFGVLNGIVGLLAITHLQGVITLGEGVALFVIGVWLSSAAGMFENMVNTEGSDIAHLLNAIKKLTNVFTLQGWLLGIACALVALLIILAIAH